MKHCEKQRMVNVWSSTQKKNILRVIPTLTHYSDIVSDILSGIFSDILSEILSGILYLTYALASILIFFLAIYGYLTYALAFYRGPAALGARDMASVDASHELAEEKAEEGVAP